MKRSKEEKAEDEYVVKSFFLYGERRKDTDLEIRVKLAKIYEKVLDTFQNVFKKFLQLKF